MFLHRYPYVLGIMKLYFYKVLMRGKLTIKGMTRFSSKASIRYRENSHITLNKGSYLAEGTLLRVTENADFYVGINSGFNSYCVITCRDKIHIGDNVMFGPFVTLHDHDHVYKTKENMKTSGYITKPIIIEDDVWIGGNVVILKGVTIGKGSVIAAGTVVTKDIPPHTIIYNKRQNIMNEIIINN